MRGPRTRALQRRLRRAGSEESEHDRNADRVPPCPRQRSSTPAHVPPDPGPQPRALLALALALPPSVTAPDPDTAFLRRNSPRVLY